MMIYFVVANVMRDNSNFVYHNWHMPILINTHQLLTGLVAQIYAHGLSIFVVWHQMILPISSIVSPLDGSGASEVSLKSLQWRHNERDGVSNLQRLHCLLSHLFGYRSKKTSKLRFTGLCAGNSPVTGEFPAQKASNAENVSIFRRHHVPLLLIQNR